MKRSLNLNTTNNTYVDVVSKGIPRNVFTPYILESLEIQQFQRPYRVIIFNK